MSELLTGADFNGAEYQREFDFARLTGQIRRVHDCMRDGRWRTLDEIQLATGDPQASISAQLRHLRKARFGAHTIEKRARGSRERGCLNIGSHHDAQAPTGTARAHLRHEPEAQVSHACARTPRGRCSCETPRPASQNLQMPGLPDVAPHQPGAARVNEQRPAENRVDWLTRVLRGLYRLLPLIFACVVSALVERRGARPAEVATVFFLALIAAQMKRE